MSKKARELVRMIYSVAGVGTAGEYLDVQVEPDTPLSQALEAGLAELVEVDDEHPPTGPVHDTVLADRDEAERAQVAELNAADEPDPDAEEKVPGESMLPNDAPETGAPYPVNDDEEPSGRAKPSKAASRRR